MYNLNYIDGLITIEKYGSAFVRFLKILNFFVHLGIIAILVFTVLTHLETEEYNRKIEKTKASIEQKRTTNKINDIEREWETQYYKVLSIKSQMDKHTNYAYVFRDLGSFLPGDNSILNLEFNKNMSTIFMTIGNDVLTKLTSFYDYAPVLNSSFEKSSYLGHDVSIQDLEERKIDKLPVKALKVSVPLNARKFQINNSKQGSEDNEQQQ